MRREYPEAPIAAVGAVVIDGDDRVLLIRRAQEPNQGTWTLPGGAVELGETLEQAVCREVWEETRLRVEPVRVVEVLDRISYNTEGRVRFHYVLVDYLCTPVAGVLCIAATDAADARWVSRGDLVSKAGLAVETMNVILKALASR